MEARFIGRPEPGEYDPYYRLYLDLVPEADIVGALEAQGKTTQALLRGVDDAAAGVPPAAGEWCLKEVVGHLTDAERVFSYRILRFSRGDLEQQPAFDQDAFVSASAFRDRTLVDLSDELAALRFATVRLVATLPPGSGTKTGVASMGPVSVRALAWITCGHERKHVLDIKQNFAHLLG